MLQDFGNTYARVSLVASTSNGNFSMNDAGASRCRVTSAKRRARIRALLIACSVAESTRTHPHTKFQALYI